jgi:hypothetical protein
MGGGIGRRESAYGRTMWDTARLDELSLLLLTGSLYIPSDLPIVLTESSMSSLLRMTLRLFLPDNRLSTHIALQSTHHISETSM